MLNASTLIGVQAIIVIGSEKMTLMAQDKKMNIFT